MNIEEFHLNLKSDVRARAEAENDFAAGAFANLMSERLSDVEEIDNLQVFHYEGLGSKRQNLAIDGFDLDDADGQISLAVVDWRDSEDIAVLSTPDAKKRLKSLEYFLTESVQNLLEDALEESSVAYQLARDLRSRGRNVSRYRLYVLTDARTSDRMKDVVSSELNGVPIEYHIWDLQRLHQIQESNSGRSEIEIDLEQWLPNGLPVLKTEGKSQDFVTYLASVPGDVVADLYGQYGSRLLESNVRSYLSARGMVNKGIKTTALSKPEMFLAYNNGITATATAVAVESVIRYAGPPRDPQPADCQRRPDHCIALQPAEGHFPQTGSVRHFRPNETHSCRLRQGRGNRSGCLPLRKQPEQGQRSGLLLEQRVPPPYRGALSARRGTGSGG